MNPVLSDQQQIFIPVLSLLPLYLLLWIILIWAIVAAL